MNYGNRTLKISTFSSGQIAAVIAVAASLSGCAIIEDIRSDGSSERSIAFSIPIVIPSGAAGQSSVVRITGFGLGGAGNAATLGWFDETVANLGPDCRVVLIGNTDQQLERFAALLPKNEMICGASKLNGGQK